MWARGKNGGVERMGEERAGPGRKDWLARSLAPLLLTQPTNFIGGGHVAGTEDLTRVGTIPLAPIFSDA